MSTDMNIQIPTDIVESAVRDKITAAIARELGDPVELINQMVSATLSKQVSSNGKVSSYDRENKFTVLEIMAKDLITAAANEAMKEYFQEHKNDIKEAVKKQISKSPAKIAQAFVSGLADSLDCKYRTTVSVNFNRESDD